VSELEQRLRDLGEHLDVPAGDGLAAGVAARLETRSAPSRTRWRVAAAVLVVGGVAVTPAVADWLGTDEVAVVQGPPPTTEPTAPPLDLGRRVTLDEAEAAAGFRPVVPAVLGEPDEVWLDDRPATPLVWLRWEGEALMTQVVGHLTDQPVLQKYTEGATVEALRIGSRPAFWIDGAHQVAIEVHDGAIVPLRLRTADSTLLVDMRTFTVRIETSAGRDAAIRIATSLPGT
jgi:hypothetical protein